MSVKLFKSFCLNVRLINFNRIFLFLQKTHCHSSFFLYWRLPYIIYVYPKPYKEILRAYHKGWFFQISNFQVFILVRYFLFILSLISLFSPTLHFFNAPPALSLWGGLFYLYIFFVITARHWVHTVLGQVILHVNLYSAWVFCGVKLLLNLVLECMENIP